MPGFRLWRLWILFPTAVSLRLPSRGSTILAEVVEVVRRMLLGRPLPADVAGALSIDGLESGTDFALNCTLVACLANSL